MYSLKKMEFTQAPTFMLLHIMYHNQGSAGVAMSYIKPHLRIARERCVKGIVERRPVIVPRIEVAIIRWIVSG